MTAESQASSSTVAPLLPIGKKKSRRGLWITLLVATLGIAGWQTWVHFPRAAKAPTFATAPATSTDLARKVTSSGTLSPLVQVEVGSQVSGRIQSLGADYNSEVKAGQIIAQIEPQLFESALASAKAKRSAAYADYKKAKAVAENAKAQYTRIKSLADSGAMSRSDADAALSSKRSAEASVSASLSAITVAKAAVEQAELNLEYTTIRSPIDGVVVSRNVDVGQTVAASLSAPVLFIIAEDLRKMEVHTTVAESDIGQLTPGMAVEFSVDAFPADSFEGLIKQVRFEATTVSGVVTYDAVIAVENAELKLRPGMTANVSFIIEAKDGVLAVPNKAFTYQPPTDTANPAARTQGRGQRAGGRPAGERAQRPSNQRRLFVLRDGAPVMVRVETGMTDGTSTEITGGELAEGDAVITSDGSGATSARPTGQAGQNRRGRNASVF